MDPASCRVIYIDDRFNTERWISREGTTPASPQRVNSSSEFIEMPADLQANVNAFLSVFNQVFVCRSGRSFSTKLSELHEQVKVDCTPIIACFDVGAELKHNHFAKSKSRFNPGAESPLPSPTILRREITFSSESDESYGLQLLSRIASDLQVDESIQLIIPVAVVKPSRKDSYDTAIQQLEPSSVARAPYGIETDPMHVEDKSDIIDPQMMLQCLDAGALDVVRSPLDKAGIMGLTVHAYRIYKHARNEQSAFLAQAKRKRKQSWVGMEEEKPYAYLREAMVKKLLKGICEPQNVIEDYQHRDLLVDEKRVSFITESVGKWSFCGHDFSEDELVYAGYAILNHALSMPELEKYRISKTDLLRFMQGCQVAYNSFVLYHNFRHAVDVLQSVFYFLVQIGILPPYPQGAESAPHANNKSPVAKLLGPFEALTLLISAIGHDVGHPGVNNMFLVKLNAPLAQLYNDQSVLEAFHCAAYSQILRRHWPFVFHDKPLRKLMISSILATDMGVHSDYMQQLGNLQEKIHESTVTDGWSPKDRETFRILTCGLLIKCADISNVARPWAVAEKWTYLLQEEFANQGEMESAVGMETTLFGGPPELGNVLKLANGQIGFMTIFAHPLFANVTDIIPAMSFAADEILTNKGVWFTKAEQEKRKQQLKKETGFKEGSSISPRSRSPVGAKRKVLEERAGYFSNSPLKERKDLSPKRGDANGVPVAVEKDETGSTTPKNASRRSSLAAAAGLVSPGTQIDPRSTSGHNTPRAVAPDQSAALPYIDNASQSRIDSQAISGKDLVVPNGAVHDSDTQAEMVDRVGEIQSELSDKRRDNAVSMRAGSESLPPLDLPPKAEDPKPELAKFTFATSEKDEPVRTYDPQEPHVPVPRGTATSAPTVPDVVSQQSNNETVEDVRQTISAQSESNTMRTSTRGGTGHENDLTPSQSTGATSYTSERSDRLSPHPKSFESESTPNRAISTSLDSPEARQPYSLRSSNNSESREGSKNDVQTTVLNGEGGEDKSDKYRKFSSRTIGRKRSRMKLKDLAFWKKRSSDKSSYDDDRSERTSP